MQTEKKKYPFFWPMFRFSPHVKVDRRWDSRWFEKCFFSKTSKNAFFPKFPILSWKSWKPRKHPRKISALPKVSFWGFGFFTFFATLYTETRKTWKKKCSVKFRISGFSEIFRNFFVNLCKSVPEISRNPRNPWISETQYLLRRAVSKTGVSGSDRNPENPECKMCPWFEFLNFRKSGNGPWKHPKSTDFTYFISRYSRENTKTSKTPADWEFGKISSRKETVRHFPNFGKRNLSRKHPKIGYSTCTHRCSWNPKTLNFPADFLSSRTFPGFRDFPGDISDFRKPSRHFPGFPGFPIWISWNCPLPGILTNENFFIMYT
jgi:hypothetical protein